MQLLKKGFYDKQKELGTILMLITSELGEAIAADQKNRHSNLNRFERIIKRYPGDEKGF